MRNGSRCKHIEVVSHFIFLGSLITNDGFCDKEIRRRLAMGRSAMGGLTKIWKDRRITLRIKIRLVKELVFLILIRRRILDNEKA